MPTAAERWAHDRLVTDFVGPSGEVYDFEIADLWQYHSMGFIPNPLLGIATKVEMEGIGVSELKEDADLSRDFFDLMCWVLARNLRKPNLVEEEGSEEAAILVVKTKMPPNDRQELIRRQLHFWNVGELGKEIASLMEAARFPDGTSGGDGEPSNRRDRRAAQRKARRGVPVLRSLDRPGAEREASDG